VLANGWGAPPGRSPSSILPPAIARRVVDLVGPASKTKTPSAEILFTSGRRPQQARQATLRGFGLRPTSDQISSTGQRRGPSR
jgi:hypothetical protein